MTCSWQSFTRNYFLVGNPDFKNPKQGIPHNCPFISALSSIVWVNSGFVANRPGPNFTYNFYDGATQVPSCVNGNLLLDGSSFCGAVLDSTDGKWPALYEKAFAKFCLYKKGIMTLAQVNTCTIDPNYSQLPNGSDWGGNSTTAMNYLTRVPVHNFKPTDTSFSDGSCTYTNFYDFIKNCICDTTLNNPPTTNGTKTKYPAGAWTYYDAGAAAAATGQSVTYSNATIVADHNYSLLGNFESAGTNYIVLRNPFGVSDPGITGLGSGNWNFKDLKYIIGAIRPAIPNLATLKTINLGAGDGIFALSTADFYKYFEYFGFVK